MATLMMAVLMDVSDNDRVREELARLPDRHCYLLDRRSGLPAVLMCTADLQVNPNRGRLAQILERASHNDAVLPVANLERAEAAVEQRIADLMGSAAMIGAGGDRERDSVGAGRRQPGRRRTLRNRGHEPLDIG